ncbi:hypothetical protein [uncultured Anaerococcus sp.]|uniref:hypothetical protein n=1 Tax=uncultured Anaerococcus sp. TaxID=293428 RepID=UPI002803ABF6|nr:hypothetical protein [uncultured Anaerococcus sp.]
MQDFYKSLCKEILRKYVQVRTTTKEIDERIEEINGRLTSITVRYGEESVQGGGRNLDDTYLDNIAKRAMLEHNNRINKAIVEMVESALTYLDDDEKDIVMTLYASGQRGAVYDLMEEYHYEKTQIYTIANRALKVLSYKMFGNA